MDLTLGRQKAGIDPGIGCLSFVPSFLGYANGVKQHSPGLKPSIALAIDAATLGIYREHNVPPLRFWRLRRQNRSGGVGEAH